MGSSVSLLAVCTHNRTRSVICAALLERHAAAAGLDVTVASAGTAAEGLAATVPAVQLLDRLGIDVSAHRSTRVTRDLVDVADLVLTAGPDEVVWIAGRWADAYQRTFTLPEIVDYVAATGERPEIAMDAWVAALARQRPPVKAYLEPGRIPGIDDPTGHRPETWERVVEQIDADCARIIDALRERHRVDR